MGDGARFDRPEGASTAVRMGEAQVRSPALEGRPVEVNLHVADGSNNAKGWTSAGLADDPPPIRPAASIGHPAA